MLRGDLKMCIASVVIEAEAGIHLAARDKNDSDLRRNDDIRSAP